MRMRVIVAATALGCVIAIVYAPVLDHAFVEFDDPLYVSANERVARGLSLESVVWAFATDTARIWHPLTWLSYLANADLNGVERAGPWLATNVALHALAAAALLAALASLTGRLAPAIVVAGLFALHPLQVESVAWVSARKEVLAGLFCMLTLLAYGAYSRQRSPARYGFLLAAFAACLLAKGTLVALPLVLLALDVWPLRRIGRERAGALVLEKLPLLALAAADLAVQLSFGARSANVWGSDPSLLERIPTAIMALGAALGRILWPTGLTIFYPTPMQSVLAPWSTGAVATVAAALVVAGVGALALARRAPAVAVGVCWFLVLLAPMSGIVPSGLRSMHDRYSYVPLVGIAIALAYGFVAVAGARPAARRAGATLAAVALGVSAVLSHQQVDTWADSERLFGHALAVTDRNAIVRYSRGIARARAGRIDEAITDLEAALEIHAGHADAHTALGHLLSEAGDVAGALPHLERAVALRPGWSLGLTNLARALDAQGDQSGALARYEEAVAAAPCSADAHYWLGLAHARGARYENARNHFAKALELEPGHRWARAALARMVLPRSREGPPGP